jgi:N-acyl-D-amino-acid deacylase
MRLQPLRRLPLASAFALLAVVSLPLPAVALPPAQGPAVPELAAFDRAMQEFMEKHDISAGQLAIMRGGVVVLDRAYGWQNKTKDTPPQDLKLLPQGALMRVASVSKPFTAAAIRALIAQGKLTLDSKVFSLKEGDGGILELAPFGTPDPRLGDITVGHLLAHRGGWDRKMAGDLSYRERRVAQEMGIASPPGAVNQVRWIMGQPLQHAPGTKRAYSNIGYMVLGLVIEKVSGEDYLAFLRKHVTRPIGIADTELILGRSLRENAHPREPYYDHPRKAPSVFYPAHSNRRLVEGPYGAAHYEARFSLGGIVTNARSLVLFLDKYTVSGRGIGRPRRDGAGRGAHGGKQKGVRAFAMQREDGINLAVIVNKSTMEGGLGDLREALNGLIDAGKIRWPER